MQETLTKAHLVNYLNRDARVQKPIAKKFVDDFFETIREILESGQHLKLSGFGNFYLRDKKERPGRNPKTGRKVAISSRRVVTFRAGQKLRSKVAEIKSDARREE